MDKLMKKLGLKDQPTVLILNAPEEYLQMISSINGVIETDIQSKYDFIQAFATNLSDATKIGEDLINALNEDGILWFCYPKGSSKKYKSDINRNKTWDIFSPYEFEPVSQVSIDEDWSAVRFKHVDKIKTMKRKTASTEKGKERIKKSN